MLRHCKEIGRLELNYERFASPSEVKSLKTVLAVEAGKRRATRSVLRVLTDKPVEDNGFVIEARASTSRGELVYFGFNSPKRKHKEEILHSETKYIANVLLTKRREPPDNLNIVRLENRLEVALELEALYSRVYKYYPEPLDASSLLRSLAKEIPYAVIENGKIVSALFGFVTQYADLPVVEFILSATKPTARGTGMTTALASRIVAEARERFDDPLFIAETIAAPVIHSCHDIGMEVRGVLREHYKISTGEKTYTNFFAWFL